MAEPKVRFKRDDGSSFPEWKRVLLGDHLIQFTDTTTENNQYPPLTSSRKGLFLQEAYFNRQVASEDNTGYNIVPYGYFTYRHMSDDTVFHFNINYLVENGIVSTLYPVFTTDESIVDKFLQIYLNESPAFSKYCVLQKQGGSRTYMYFAKLCKYSGFIPCLEEQQKIADFLFTVDEVITASEKEVANLETQKKAVMKKIFSQEVRFKRVDGSEFPEWEEHVIHDFCKVSSGEFVIKTKQDDSYPYPVFNGGTENTGYYSEYNYDGSYILMSSRGANAGYVNKYIGRLWCGNSCYAVRIIDDSISTFEFLYHACKYHQYDFLSNQQTGSIPAVNKGQLEDFSLLVPTDFEEQRLIADFLSDFDEAISAAKKELELWKELKKGLLQQMFV